jgi:CheY-like chemotaxis protein
MAILCVDDYEPYLHLVVESLEDAGYKVFGTKRPVPRALDRHHGERCAAGDYGLHLALHIGRAPGNRNSKIPPVDADHPFDPNRRRFNTRRV